MNWPVIAGRPYLYEATIHGRPVAGALNFPENAASRAVWRGLRADDEAAIRRSGIRYLVVHDDATAGPGPQDDVVSRLERAKEPLSASPGLRVYLLW